MARDNIDDKHKPLIWGKAAGCCELCAKPVYEEGLRRQSGNYTNLAHICAASPGGPRYDDNQTKEERASFDNAMLLCFDCHKLIDDSPEDFPAEMLREMKRKREDDVASLMEGLRPERYNMVRYIAPFGETDFELSDSQWKRAMFTLPAAREGRRPFDLNPSRLDSRKASSIPDMARDLERMYARFMDTHYEGGPIAVFALASQPLLIKLGVLIGDETPFVCFQKRRGPEGWDLSDSPFDDFFTLEKPSPDSTATEAVLKLSVSGRINDASIPKELTSAKFPTFELSAQSPSVCKADSRDSGEHFKIAATNMLYKLHEDHPLVKKVHVFPAMPVSLNVVFGSVLNTHVIPEFVIYEKRESEFAEALTIGGAHA